MKFEAIDLTGQRFRRLVAIERVANRGPSARWLCNCDCGKQKITSSASLRGGRTGSCGCYMKQRAGEANFTHGKTGTQEHRIWTGMLNRCRNPKVKAFPYYGGRGIKVCDAWKKFEVFLQDMGPRPSKKHSLERIKTDGDYEPGNVRWATQLEQANNKRRTRFVDYQGRRVSLNDAVRAAGSVIHYEAAWIRIKTGWPVARALETPRTRISPNSNLRRNG